MLISYKHLVDENATITWLGRVIGFGENALTWLIPGKWWPSKLPFRCTYKNFWSVHCLVTCRTGYGARCWRMQFFIKMEWSLCSDLYVKVFNYCVKISKTFSKFSYFSNHSKLLMHGHSLWQYNSDRIFCKLKIVQVECSKKEKHRKHIWNKSLWEFGIQSSNEWWMWIRAGHFNI